MTEMFLPNVLRTSRSLGWLYARKSRVDGRRMPSSHLIQSRSWAFQGTWQYLPCCLSALPVVGSSRLPADRHMQERWAQATRHMYADPLRVQLRGAMVVQMQ
jgi:hypothetical protein